MTHDMMYHITVDEKQSGERLDKFLVAQLPEFTRTRVQALIKDACVTCTDVTLTDRSYRVKQGDSYTVTVPPVEETTMQAAAHIKLDILYEDEYLLVINKQAGLTVHPGAGNHQDTLANALLAHCGDSLSGIGGVQRPGIVHRLDKDTSGLMVVAKQDIAHVNLSEQLAQRKLKRIYQAMVWGVPSPPAGKIGMNIGRSEKDRTRMKVMVRGGKTALTHYKIIEVLPHKVASLVECRLETGRTHQIRVHMQHKGYPLIGDQTYGKVPGKRMLEGLRVEAQDALRNFPRQVLHSCYISFIHPASDEWMEFYSNLPDDISELITIVKE